MNALTKKFLSVLVVIYALTATPGFAAQVGPESVLPASPKPAHRPHVSYAPSAGSGQGNGQYLVVWESGLAEYADIYGCRLNAEGKPIDNQPFVIGKAVECQEWPRAAWGQDSWLVVWSDLRNDKDFDVYGARVSADGKVLDPDGILLAGGEHNQCKPDAAWSPSAGSGSDGGSWLVVWRAYESPKYAAYGARVSSDGKLRDSKPIEVARFLKHWSSVTEPRVCATGAGWLVAYTGALILPGGQPGWFRRGIYTTIVTANGQATPVDTAETLGEHGPRGPATVAANGGNDYLIAWANHGAGGRGGPSNIDHACRTDAQGKNLGFITWGPRKDVNIRQPSAAWDGKGWLVACWDGNNRPLRDGRPAVSRIVGQLVTDDGKYEGAIEISSGDPNPAYQPAAAGDGKGNALVVYERHPEKAGDTILIAAKLVKR